MKTVVFKLSELKNKLESAAFLVSKEGATKEAHSELIQGLIIISELESIYEAPKDLSSQTTPTKKIVLKLIKLVENLNYGQNVQTKLTQKY